MLSITVSMEKICARGCEIKNDTSPGITLVSGFTVYTWLRWYSTARATVILNKLLLFIIIGTYRLTKNIFRKLSYGACKLWILSQSQAKVGEIWDFCLCLLSHNADGELHWQSTGRCQKVELFVVSYIHWAGDMIQGFGFLLLYFNQKLTKWI